MFLAFASSQSTLACAINCCLFQVLRHHGWIVILWLPYAAGHAVADSAVQAAVAWELDRFQRSVPQVQRLFWICIRSCGCTSWMCC